MAQTKLKRPSDRHTTRVCCEVSEYAQALSWVNGSDPCEIVGTMVGGMVMMVMMMVMMVMMMVMMVMMMMALM